MYADRALELIKEVGIGRLCGFDGCLCGQFRVHGVSVDISCRKSSGGCANIVPADFYGFTIRVYSRSLDKDPAGFSLIADEVIAQFRAMEGDGGYAALVRFCAFRHDHEKLCVYCEQKRDDAAGYLCGACLDKPEVASRYDWRSFNRIVPECWPPEEEDEEHLLARVTVESGLINKAARSLTEIRRRHAGGIDLPPFLNLDNRVERPSDRPFVPHKFGEHG